MKNYSLLTVFFSLLLVFSSCSNDNSEITELENELIIAHSTYNNAFDVYIDELDSLYQNYSISKDRIKVTDEFKVYYVNEVIVGSNIEAYLLEDVSESKVYLIDKNNDFIDIFDHKENTVDNYNLNFDAEYDEIGFNISEPYGNSTSQNRRPFWGTKIVNGASYSCGNGCTCTSQFEVQYVFWISITSYYVGTIVECP